MDFEKANTSKIGKPSIEELKQRAKNLENKPEESMESEVAAAKRAEESDATVEKIYSDREKQIEFDRQSEELSTKLDELKYGHNKILTGYAETDREFKEKIKNTDDPELKKIYQEIIDANRSEMEGMKASFKSEEGALYSQKDEKYNEKKEFNQRVNKEGREVFTDKRELAQTLVDYVREKRKIAPYEKIADELILPTFQRNTKDYGENYIEPAYKPEPGTGGFSHQAYEVKRKKPEEAAKDKMGRNLGERYADELGRIMFSKFLQMYSIKEEPFSFALDVNEGYWQEDYINYFSLASEKTDFFQNYIIPKIQNSFYSDLKNLPGIPPRENVSGDYYRGNNTERANKIRENLSKFKPEITIIDSLGKKITLDINLLISDEVFNKRKEREAIIDNGNKIELSEDQKKLVQEAIKNPNISLQKLYEDLNKYNPEAVSKIHGEAVLENEKFNFNRDLNKNLSEMHKLLKDINKLEDEIKIEDAKLDENKEKLAEVEKKTKDFWETFSGNWKKIKELTEKGNRMFDEIENGVKKEINAIQREIERLKESPSFLERLSRGSKLRELDNNLSQKKDEANQQEGILKSIYTEGRDLQSKTSDLAKEFTGTDIRNEYEFRSYLDKPYDQRTIGGYLLRSLEDDVLRGDSKVGELKNQMELAKKRMAELEKENQEIREKIRSLEQE